MALDCALRPPNGRTLTARTRNFKHDRLGILPFFVVAALLMTAQAVWAQEVIEAKPAPKSAVQVVVENPRSGEVVKNRVHMAPLRGSASADRERPTAFDVILAIDVSQSTDAASGIDVDGDGIVGINPRYELLPPGTYPPDVLNTDPGDSILAGQVKAATVLLDSLDSARVRVGIVTFAGEVNAVTGERARIEQEDAWLEQSLTNDYARLRQALPGVLARGARGATNFAAGIRLAVVELAGLSGALSQPNEQAKKVILFLTDGTPTFPIGKGVVSDAGDVEAAISAAKLAHEAGATINSYGLGPGALTYPFALTEIARVTLGTYSPVQNPGDIVALLQGVSFANIEDVVFTNLTTGDFSTDVRLSPDGSFSGFVPVKEGINRVRVTALASDGTRGSVELEIDFAVAELSDRELALELERVRQRNKELQLLLERQRIEQFRKHEKQRKELEIRTEPESAD